MKKLIAVLLMGAAIMTGAGCHSGRETGTPGELLDRYFSSAIKQDYAAAYGCYYAAYQAKVSRDEYIRHRKEASVLLSYRVTSLAVKGDSAEARVDLTFGPSEKLKRTQPVTKPVVENMVRENGEWKIKVW